VGVEEKVTDISCNMPLLMVGLAINIGMFGEVGGSNSNIRSHEKSGDNKYLENNLREELEKEKLSSNTINPSQYLFNMEEKVYINTYKGDIDALKLNHWLQQLEFFFNVHHIDEKNIYHFLD
jgi:hypothetical protein